MVIVIIALIAAVGWLVYKDQNNTYAGWDTYTLREAKLSFRYPATWELKHIKDKYDDVVYLTSSDNFSMLVGAGVNESTMDIPDDIIVMASPITFNGHTAYLDGLASGNNSPKGPISVIILSRSNTNPTSYVPGNNPKLLGPTVVEMDWGYSNNLATKSLSALKTDVNYKNAKLVIESISY